MTAVNFTRKPSSWHSKYRTMDDVCQLIRAFRKYREQEPMSPEWTQDSLDVTDTSEVDIVAGLIVILRVEFEKLGWSFTRTVLAPAADAFGRLTFSSSHHFVYGILDLLQQHGRTNSGKVSEKIMSAALKIVHKSSPSFLRTKAFEVLASLKESELSNHVTLKQIQSWPDKDAQRKAKDEWRRIKAQVEDMEGKRNEIRDQMPQSRPVDNS
jgi:hypothetical protein